MKKITISIILILSSITSFSQTYYNMWRGSGASGQPEWIANTAMTYGFTGIQFTTADRICGYANAFGRWLFMDPNESVTSSQHINLINGRLNAMPHVAVGTSGYIAANRFIVTDLDFTSGVDFFVGYGRGNQMTISNQMTSLLRINSYGGIGFWGNGLAGDNDNPLVTFSGNSASFNVPLTTVNSNIPFTIKSNSANDAAWIGTTSNSGIEVGTNNICSFYIGNGQNVFFGFNKSNATAIKDALKTKYRVFVDKGILSEDYAIAPKSTWSDYVFSKDYSLRDISEVENYIEEYNHLPDVPSAADVAENGYSQHDMNSILLQKIEELTLYIIQQKKEIEYLKTKITE